MNHIVHVCKPFQYAIITLSCNCKLPLPVDSLIVLTQPIQPTAHKHGVEVARSKKLQLSDKIMSQYNISFDKGQKLCLLWELKADVVRCYFRGMTLISVQTRTNLLVYILNKEQSILSPNYMKLITFT